MCNGIQVFFRFFLAAFSVVVIVSGNFVIGHVIIVTAFKGRFAALRIRAIGRTFSADLAANVILVVDVFVSQIAITHAVLAPHLFPQTIRLGTCIPAVVSEVCGAQGVSGLLARCLLLIRTQPALFLAVLHFIQGSLQLVVALTGILLLIIGMAQRGLIILVERIL